MVPIHELLNRIRWDPEFGRGTFELGYFDRVEGRIMVVPFREVAFPEDDPQSFQLVDTEGASGSPFTAFEKSTKTASSFGKGRRTQNEKPLCRSTPGDIVVTLASASSLQL